MPDVSIHLHEYSADIW